MSISARLFVEDQEYNILEFDLKFNQEVDFMGNPISNFKGGYWDIKLETIKSPLLLQWMLDSDSMKKVKIVIPSRFGTSKSRNIELLDTYCISNNKAFNSTNIEPLTTSITLSPASMIENGEVLFSKSWRITDPTPKEQKPVKENDTEKKLILSFIAEEEDFESGKFGFDRFDENYKDIYTGKDFSKLENEYNPIQVYGEKYFPVWVSMRKGQTITLNLDQIKLGKVKSKNVDLFNEIKFEDHPDFTFFPENLKGAKKVNITCNNNNISTAQIKVEADGETVGAINFFYPEPKTVSLDWRYVEVTGNKKDETVLLRKLNNIKLTQLLQKAFNPMLIDFTIDNEIPKIADISKENLNVVIFKAGETEYILRSRKGYFITYTENTSTPSGTSLTLYLVNRICMDKANAEIEEGQYSAVAGFSDPGSGRAYGILADKEGKMVPEAVAHEIMHALGLEHTFDGQNSHIFEGKATKNYMDYSSSKIYTWKWQWEIARNHKLLK